jgi:hypothetical protein
MMNLKMRWLGLGFFVVAVLAGCGGAGGGSSPAPPLPVSVAFSSPPPTTIAVGSSAGFTAVVSNATNTSVTWSVTCGSTGSCGSFPINEGGLDYVSYQAPGNIPSGKTVTVTATSVADTTKSVSATMTVTADVEFTAPMPASLQVSRSVQIGAGVIGGSETAQVQFTVACPATDCGSFNPALTASIESFNSTYTTPAAVPPGGTVTITATSVEDTTQSVSATVSITPQVPNLPNGTYVFQIVGDDETGFSNTTGVFVAQDGVILGGEQDSNSMTTLSVGGPSILNPQFWQISSGSYSITPDGDLEISLLTSGGAPETLTGVPISGSQGFVTQLFTVGGNGTLEMQSSTAAPSGGYAFSLGGWDKKFQASWWSGILNVDSPGGISGAGSVFDFTDFNAGSGLAYTAQPFAATTISSPDQYGRVVLKLSPAQSASPGSIYLAGYVVDNFRIRLLETGGSFAGDVTGLALGQGASTGNFGASSIGGSSYVFGMSGQDQNGLVQAAGVLNFTSGGSVSGTMTWEDPTSAVSKPSWPVIGTWTIDPTGRLTINNLNNGSTGQPTSFSCDLEFYLTGDGNGLLMSTNTMVINIAGQAFKQQAGTLSAAQFVGGYGFNGFQQYSSNLGGEVPPTAALYGQFNSVAGSGSDSLTGFANSLASSDFAVSGSFANESNGILSGTITGLNPSSSSEPDPYYLYMIDSNRAVAIETDRADTIDNLMTLIYLGNQ